MENPKNSRNKASSKKSKISKLLTPLLASTLFFANPDGAIAQNTSNQTRNKAEVSTSTILDRLDQKLGVSLPDEYKDKVLDFVLNDTIMRTRSATAYTENFLLNIMKNNPGISKENRLLFNRSSIYGGISKKFLYDRLDDENEFRANEYEKALKQINEAYENYKNGFKTYMEEGINESEKKINESQKKINESQKKIKEYDEQSAKAREQSAKAREQSAKAREQSAKSIEQIKDNAVIRFGERLTDFYDIYIRNPDIVKKEDIDFHRNETRRLIEKCKDPRINIDYKAIILEAVGDRRKVEEMLKFYGVE